MIIAKCKYGKNEQAHWISSAFVYETHAKETSLAV
jgi:hypothetical protein